MLSIAKTIYRLLPTSVRNGLSPLRHTVMQLLDENYRDRTKWLRTYFSNFGMKEREYIFTAIARFCHTNRPMTEGYYFEFGCFGGNTMRLAWKHSRHLFNWTYVGFDSFEGLPPLKPIDQQKIWAELRLAMDEPSFISTILDAGMPRSRLITVKGYYDKVLTAETATKLLPKKAVVIYIDCDLYHSTVPVLKFIKPFLQVGTIIVFDDWNIFWANPRRGMRRAWGEFLDTNPELDFVSFVSTSESQCFIYVGDKNRTEDPL